MWNKRNDMSAGRVDPFAARPAKTERLSAESVKCPTCAANLFYQPEVGGLLCRFCGNVYNPSTMEVVGSFGATGEHDYVGDNEISADDKRRHEIVCSSCGSQLIADENTMSTMCPFCGSPALITRRMTREFKPDYIIPFKIDRKQAEKNMNAWLKTRKYTPWGFKSKSRLTKMTALYVPFWLLDCAVNTELSGTGKRYSGKDIGTYEVNSKLSYYVRNVPFDASKNIANKLMEAIEPFDYGKMVKFENKYLQGFYANKYDQNASELADRMLRRIDRFSLSETDRIAKKYDSYSSRHDKTFSWMSEVKTKYCLLPVWFMTVESGGRQYQFAVNGQTGEASGQVPTTSFNDKLEAIVHIARSNWKFVPVFALPVIATMIFNLIKDLQVSTTTTVLVILLSILGGLCVLSLVLGLFAYIFSALVSQRIRKVADVVNDYDKDPGLDEYLDTARRSTLTTDELCITHHVYEEDDEDDRTFAEHFIELY